MQRGLVHFVSRVGEKTTTKSLRACVVVACDTLRRYLKRGVSDTGNVANDVEVEQVRAPAGSQLLHVTT